MDWKSKTSRTTQFVLSLVFCLLIGYVAAYFFCVQQSSSNGNIWHAKFTSDVEAEYRYIGSWGRLFFAPAHSIDRLARPETWNNKTREIERSLGIEYE